jgi:hypothetical protein
MFQLDHTVPWISMEKEKPNKEWIVFIPKDPCCCMDRGYAFPEQNRVLFPWGYMDFDEIEYWVDGATMLQIETESDG